MRFKSEKFPGFVLLAILACGMTGCQSLSNLSQISACVPAVCESESLVRKTADGCWWTVFHDPVLNKLVERVEPNNLQLRSIETT